MRHRCNSAIIIAAVTLTVTSCGGETESGAVTVAAKACTVALAQEKSGQPELEVVDNRSSAAETAANAADLDPRWSQLASAASDWDQTTRDLFKATSNAGDLNAIQVAQLTSDASKARRDIYSECQKVRAAGGSVSTLADWNN